ncbi:MAG: hypothetical protein ACHP7N_04080 [Caulobacterales bacterium]
MSIADDPTLNAYEAWGGALKAKFGEAYVEGPQHNCGEGLNDVAAKAFAALRPTTIRVGTNLINHPECASPGSPG